MTEYVSTGCRTLDEMLEGGLPLGKVTLIYGEPSTGKSTLALTSVTDYLGGEENGLSSRRVLYVDSDGKLSLDRFAQIAGQRAAEFLKRVIVSVPRSFAEQTMLIEELESYTSGKIGLVVFDTVTSLYLEEVASTGEVFALNRELNRQLAYLREVVKSQLITVILLSQVHSALQFEPPSVAPVSTRLLRYWPDVILRLEPTFQTGVKTAFIEKPRRSISGCRFRLSPSGPVDLGPTEQSPRASLGPRP